MSNCTWNGKAGKGAMKARREQKRIDAELRNEDAQPVRFGNCGHRHGAGQGC